MALLLILAFILLSVFLYINLIYPALLSPLSKIPNAHFTSSFSNGWILWQRYMGRENQTIHDVHTRLGPIVRLGITEISVNSVEALRTVYSNRLDKHEFYSRAFDNYGVSCMFSTIPKGPHGERRRMLAGLYTKTTVQASEDIKEISQNVVIKHLLPIIEESARDQRPVDALELSLATAMDFITGYLFGLSHSSRFLQEETVRKAWLDVHKKSKGHSFWYLELPGLTTLLSKLGIYLVPPPVVSATDKVKDLCLQLLKNVESSSNSYSTGFSLKSPTEDIPSTRPIVFEQLAHHLYPTKDAVSGRIPTVDNEVRLRTASELMDNMVAGTETTGWTLTYLLYELSKHQNLQSPLRAELLSIASPIIFHSESGSCEIPHPRSLDSLPLLEAIIMETLRLHPAVAGPQPRVTPRSPISLGEYANIPSGIRISAQAYTLHRNAEVFPDPETWIPERWIKASKPEKDEMMRWFWAFGSGARMCTGSHFALLELKLIVAAIYTNFESVVIDDDGIEQVDGFSAGPKGNKLILQFARA